MDDSWAAHRVQVDVTLNLGSYYVIGARTDGADLWGDIISNNSPDNGNNGQISWNSEYVQVGSDAIYPVANLGFDVVQVPEPGTLTLSAMGLAAMALYLARRKR